MARVNRGLSRRFTLGTILVNKQSDVPESGWGRYNRAGGIDLRYSSPRGVNLQGFAARTWDSDIEGAHDARFVRADYSGSLFSGRASFLDIENGFEPAAGFVNRRKGMDGFRRYKVQGRMRPRPEMMRIRYLSLGPQLEVITDPQNQVKFWEGSFSCWTQFSTGDWLRIIEVVREHNVVDTPFSPSSRRKELEIPAGSYTFTSFSTGLFGNRSRKLRPRLSLEAGN